MMIDVNKIRTMPALTAMAKVLTDFLTADRAEMVQVYTEQYQWGEEDLDADRELAQELLERVDRRTKSLGRHLAKADTNASQTPPADETEASEPSSVLPS